MAKQPRHLNYRSNCLRLAGLFMVFLSPLLWAGSIGDISDSLLGLTGIVTKVVDIVCYALGAVFLLMSIAQYKIHRQSPKLVPLTTPILLAFLGVLGLCIPYITTVIETGKWVSRAPSTKTDSSLPLPTLDEPKTRVLPMPNAAPSGEGAKQEAQSPPSSSQAPKRAAPSTSRHWAE